jgi:hypothetical protein
MPCWTTAEQRTCAGQITAPVKNKKMARRLIRSSLRIRRKITSVTHRATYQTIVDWSAMLIIVAGTRTDGSCPLWIIRVVVAVGQPLPVYPDEQTSSDSVGVSQTCEHLAAAAK